MSGLLLHYIALAHLGGGLMLAVGVFSPFAALMQIPILAGAVFVFHRQDGPLAFSQSLEFSALDLFLLVVFLITGSGRSPSTPSCPPGTVPPPHRPPGPQSGRSLRPPARPAQLWWLTLSQAVVSRWNSQ